VTRLKPLDISRTCVLSNDRLSEVCERRSDAQLAARLDSRDGGAGESLRSALASLRRRRRGRVADWLSALSSAAAAAEAGARRKDDRAPPLVPNIPLRRRALTSATESRCLAESSASILSVSWDSTTCRHGTLKVGRKYGNLKILTPRQRHI